jgi:hypothetical protein
MIGPILTADEIRTKAGEAAFGERLVSNIYRGLVAEVIVGAALGPKWYLCSDDWSAWDFEHIDGCRLEVKQYAARDRGRRQTRSSIFLHEVAMSTNNRGGTLRFACSRTIRSLPVAPIIASPRNGGFTSCPSRFSRSARRSA